MATPSTFIFRGLSPQTASARLANTSVLGSARSLAALRYSLPATSGLVPLIDRFVRAVERKDLKNALVYKRLIEGRMQWMSPKVLAQALFRVSGRSSKSRPIQRFSEARPSLAMTADGLLVVSPPSNTMQVKAPRDPLRRQVQRANLLRDQVGREEEAAELFGKVARGYEGRGEFFKATHHYASQGKMFLAVDQWTKAVVAYAQSRLCLAKATASLGPSVTVKTAKKYLLETIQRDLDDCRTNMDEPNFGNLRFSLLGEVAKQMEHRRGETRILIAHARYVLAIFLSHFGQDSLALEQAELAADLFSEANLPQDVGDVYTTMAKILASYQLMTEIDFRQMAKYYDAAALAYHDSSDHEEEARLFELKAKTLYEAGLFVFALSAFGEMGGAYAELHNADKLQESQIWKLRALARSGHVESATRSWLTTVEIASKRQDKKTLALAYGELARMVRLADDHEKESNYFSQAGNLYLEMGEKEQAATYYGLASIAQKLAQQLEAAEQSWKKAVALLTEVGDRSLEETLYFAIDKDYLDFGYNLIAIEMHRSRHKAIQVVR